MNDESTHENDDESEKSKYYWTEWFLSLKGNEFFCEIDEEYILDKFNLTNLNTEVPQYNLAYDLITDELGDISDSALRIQIEKAARMLYGLIHVFYFNLGPVYSNYQRINEDGGEIQGW